jgi:DNA-binding CsgD family transcriptional regulator
MLKQIGGRATSIRRTAVDDLTDREFEVFRLIGKGYGTRQISDELNLSVKTVETYHAHIKEKIGLKNARELVQYAIQWSMTESQTQEDTRAASRTF